MADSVDLCFPASKRSNGYRVFGLFLETLCLAYEGERMTKKTRYFKMGLIDIDIS